MKIHLRHVLAIAFTVTAIVPVLIFGTWVAETALKKELAAVSERHLLLARNNTLALERYAKDVKATFDYMLTTVDGKQPPAPLVEMARNIGFRHICLIDSNGRVVHQLKVTDGLGGRFSTELLGRLRPQVTDVTTFSDVMADDAGRPTIYVTRRLAPDRIAVGALDLEFIRQVQKAVAFGRKGHAAIVDRSGNVIAHPRADWQGAMRNIAAVEPVARMMAGENGVTTFFAPAVDMNMITGYATVPSTGWGVMVPQPLDELEQRAWEVRRVALGLIVVGLAAAALISWLLSGLLLQPVKGIIRAARDFTAGSLDSRVPALARGSPTEFRELGFAFNAMTDDLAELINDGKTAREELRTAREELEQCAEEKTREVGLINAQLLEEIAERKKAERRAKHLAFHDALTGLPNRYLFEDRLEKAMANAHRHGQLVALHFMDLNRFKEINDTLGHAVGDEVLKSAAATLKGVVRETDSVARFGGDKFTVIQTEVDNPHGAAVLAQKIVDAMARPVRIADHEARTGVTVGVAVYPNDGTESATLLQNADFALYAGKAKGRNRYEFFDSAMRASMTARKTLEKQLALGLERDEFAIYYQPRIDVASGLVIGVEALVRWRHPDRGVVLPSEFIPVAEASGMIRPLGEWVLRTACSDAAGWRAAGLPSLSMAVNLSAGQFHKADLVAVVGGIVDDSGLAPDQLELEITETMMMNERDTNVVPTLQRLRDLGIRIAVDDFGTGYASLTYLRQFPVSKVKIDKSFVRGITHTRDDEAIVESVIRLGHGLDMKVTAEGVETEEEVTILERWNCDEAQGYYFSRPVPSEDLVALLQAWNRRTLTD